MDLLCIIYPIVSIVGIILITLLISIDAINDLRTFVIFGCVIAPPLIVIVSVVLAVTTLCDFCSENKAKIRKFLRLKDQNNIKNMSTPDYIEYRLDEWVDAIQEEINLNETNTNEQGEQVVPFDGYIHSEEVIKELRNTIKLTKQCYVRLKHARKLLEGDYGDGMYILRLKEELEKLEIDSLKKND